MIIEDMTTEELEEREIQLDHDIETVHNNWMWFDEPSQTCRHRQTELDAVRVELLER